MADEFSLVPRLTPLGGGLTVYDLFPLKGGGQRAATIAGEMCCREGSPTSPTVTLGDGRSARSPSGGVGWTRRRWRLSPRDRQFVAGQVRHKGKSLSARSGLDAAWNKNLVSGHLEAPLPRVSADHLERSGRGAAHDDRPYKWRFQPGGSLFARRRRGTEPGEHAVDFGAMREMRSRGWGAGGSKP